VQREKINIVWFKRDLRLKDHKPLKLACEDELPALLIYLFEPSLVADPHYGTRHWRFVMQSLLEMKGTLEEQGHNLLIFFDEAETFFRKLNESFENRNLKIFRITARLPRETNLFGEPARINSTSIIMSEEALFV